MLAGFGGVVGEDGVAAEGTVEGPAAARPSAIRLHALALFPGLSWEQFPPATLGGQEFRVCAMPTIWVDDAIIANGRKHKPC